MTAGSCVFCDAARGAGDLVLESDRTLVLLHPDWSPRGHAMVVAKRHVENASDLDEVEWLDLARIWRRVERVLLELTGAERAVVMKLGIATPHLHVHIYPAHATDTRADVFAAIDGERAEPRDEAFVNAVRRHLTDSTG